MPSVLAIPAVNVKLSIGDEGGQKFAAWLTSQGDTGTKVLNLNLSGDLAKEAFNGSLLGHRVTVLGCAFKPNSDDVRDSPALAVAGSLSLAGAAVSVYDPEGMDNAKKVFPTLDYAADADDALREAELVILATEWKQFKELDPQQAGQLVDKKHIIDGRNVLSVADWQQAGWKVEALGRTL